jgi:3-deoxy-D-manno-octulosonate 8-phosphate phosphatase (KDO 8-P phosphatase)
MPSRLPPNVRTKLEPIRLLVLDVDGVLTDGTLYYTAAGEELKTFSVRDGLAIVLLQRAGIEVGIITARGAEAVATRCRDLGIRDELVVLSSRHKADDLDRMLAGLGLVDDQVAAMGDDLPDLPVLTRSGFAFCPADAAPEVAAVCDYVCGRDGGRGAVREAAEILLKAKGRWTALVAELSGLDRKPG